MSNYPEHDKLSEISDESQICGEFYEWLQSQGYSLCKPDDHDRFQPSCVPVRRLLAQFFEIDEAKVEAEKRDMLDKMARANSPDAVIRLSSLVDDE